MDCYYMSCDMSCDMNYDMNYGALRLRCRERGLTGRRTARELPER